MIRIAVLASGNGSNAEQLVKNFKQTAGICVSLIVTNKADAFVLKRAARLDVPALYLSKELLRDPAYIIKLFRKHQIDFIILAGWLKLIPKDLIHHFPKKIINIHPALLPKYGGKGMYGSHVHKAVIKAGEKESGISIHYVNEQYDEGQIIAQYTCAISETDTPDSLAEKIHQLEYAHYPEVCESVIRKTFNLPLN